MTVVLRMAIVVLHYLYEYNYAYYRVKLDQPYNIIIKPTFSYYPVLTAMMTLIHQYLYFVH